MKPDHSLVQICMATFNGEAYLTEQLDSILSQTHTEWSLIVHDDGSDDRTVAILEEYRRLHPQKIRILDDSLTFGSAKDNFFHILDYCDGDYIFFCDQDDVWFPEKIERSLMAFDSSDFTCSPEIPILVHADLEVVDEYLATQIVSMNAYLNGRKGRVSKFGLLLSNPVTGCTMCINRALKDLLHSHDKAMMHDWFFALLCLYREGQIVYLDETLIKYRQHGSNTEGFNQSSSFRKLCAALLQLPRYFRMTRRIHAQATYFKRCSYVMFLFKRIFHSLGGLL